MSETSGDLGSFLSGFIIGGLVGAAVALLMAPQSGEETRTLLKDKSIELKDKATETAEEARVRAERLAEEARARAEELRRRGQEIYAEQKVKLEKAIESGKEAVKRIPRPPAAEEAPAEPAAAE